MFRFFAFSIILFMMSITAHAADWTVTRTSGDVQVVRDGVQPISLGASNMVRPGDKITTGANGRIMLSRGEETITLAPNTELTIPHQAGAGGRTTLLQSVGKVVFEVEKRNVQHFEVETPFLAAVVKGTRFTVDVRRYSTSVSVERGVVEVLDLDTGQYVTITRGEQVRTVNRADRGLSFPDGRTQKDIQYKEPRKSRAGADGPATREAKIKTKKNTVTKTANGLKLNKPLGAVKLDVGRSTKGLAVATQQGPGNQNNNRGNANNNGNGLALALGHNKSNGGGAGLGVGAGNGNGGGAGVSAQASAGGLGLGLGLGNGNGPGNGNGKALGLKLGKGKGKGLGLGL